MYDYSLTQSPSDSRLNSPALPQNNRKGLPNSVREALLAADFGDSSLLMDALLYCGVPVGKFVTVRKILSKLRNYRIPLSEALVRRALNSGVFLWSTIQTHHRGRPEKIYAMLTIEDLIKKHAHGVATASDALVAKDMPNLRQYRQSLHREFIRRAPGIYSREFLGSRLGVGKRTTRNYDLREGIRSVRRLSEQNVRWFINWEDLITTAKPGVNWLRIHYKSGKYYDAPPNLNIAKRTMWKPYVASVSIVTQLCNRYVYDPEPDWKDRQFLYSSDDERSFIGSTDPNGFRSERLTYDPKSVTLSVDSKAYKPKSDPISSWVPPELAAKRISVNPHLPRHKLNQ